MKHLLLHSCCAPCSPYVIRKLAEEYRVTVFFYNPNIHGPAEYELRLNEIRRLCAALGVELLEGGYDPERYFTRVGPLAFSGEGGERCSECFRLRLDEACRIAGRIGAGVVATTLSVSPHKKTGQINTQGRSAVKEYEDLTFLEADFKKKDGYRISGELSAEYGFYRQNYCGCIYSKAESERRNNAHPAPPGG